MAVLVVQDGQMQQQPGAGEVMAGEQVQRRVATVVEFAAVVPIQQRVEIVSELLA